MTSRERIVRQLTGRPTDRIPMLGGWMEGAANLAELGGTTLDAYLADPWAGVLRANRALHVDGMVPPIVPQSADEVRSGSLQESSFATVEPEALLERANATPDSEAAVLAGFDLATEEANHRRHFEDMLGRLGDIVLIPTLWHVPANFSLYFEYGYEAFLSATALYPEAVAKIWWADGVKCRARNRMLVKLFKEYDLVPVLFCGHDICNGAGPMCSPDFLRRHYWPHVRDSLEPLVAAGIRLVCHCDGNVMPLIGDFVAAGFSGFQGFQYECGVDPYRLAATRGRGGEEPLFFAGLSVSRTLAFGSEQDVRDEVDYVLDYTGGGRGLFLFTSNVTGVEVPPANLRAAYAYLESLPPPGPRRPAVPRPWPWSVAYPDGRIPLRNQLHRLH